MTRLEIALLGAFQVSKQGNPITRFETDPTRALLAYLAMHARTPFRRDVLADLLWPERPRSEALHALRQTLNRLRRAIKDHESNPPFLHTTRQTIRFNPDGDYWLDTDTFASLTTTVQEHAHRRLEACNICMQQLAQAADLYRGDLLSGFNLDSLPFQEWLTMEREHLHRQAMEVFYRLAACHNRRGEHEQAQHYARRQLKLEPWREEAHRQLMIALALSGQRSAALAQYETCCRTLSDELGVEPDADTVALYEQVRCGNLPAGETPPHNLPARLARFVGREAELARIAEQLNDPNYRLLTLVGPGGVGKTQLALAAARQAAPYFPDGTWFVPLIDVCQEPEDGLHDRLAATIAGVMGITFSGQDDPKIELLGDLSSKEVLLILDNFEHLTSSVGFVLEILRQAPKVAVLVTSRARLNARAERLVQVTGLPLPLQDDDPDAGSYNSVQLFVDRARYTPEMLARDLPQIVSVCRLVEGLPLAIELASVLVEHLPLDEIIANLHHDIDFLSTTLQDIPERHRRLHAVFERSWRLLSEPEQRALAQFTVFCGGFSRAAALAVTEARQADLVGLAHKSMLQHNDSDRYDLHALVRQFAAEKLEMFPTLMGVHDRHSTYYLAFVRERAAALQGDASQQATAEIQTEMANVRQAWQWATSQVGVALDSVPHIDALGRCSEGLAQFYTQMGLLQEGERVFRETADRVRPLVQEQEGLSLSAEDWIMSLQVLAKLLAAQGHFLVWLSDHSAAVTVLQEADATLERAATTLPDSILAERAMLQANLGTLYKRVGEYALAVQHLEAGLALARQADVPQMEIVALSRLGQAASEQGDYDEAKQYVEAALAVARKCGDRTSEASAVSMFGSIVMSMGDIERSERCLRESLVIYRELGDRHKIPRLLNSLASVAMLQGEHDRAEAYFVESLTLARDMGDRQAVSDVLCNLGYINHHYLGNLEEAGQYYQESLSISQETGHRLAMTSIMCNLGNLHALMGEHDVAWLYLRQALSDSVTIGAVPLTLDALVSVARLRVEGGQYVLAAELVGLVTNHPATEAGSIQLVEQVLAELRDVLPAKQLAAALERGKGMNLDGAVADLLAEE